MQQTGESGVVLNLRCVSTLCAHAPHGPVYEHVGVLTHVVREHHTRSRITCVMSCPQGSG